MILSHATTNATNHPYKNKGLTPVKRRLLFRAGTPKEKAQRLRWAIGLYFAMCVSLSVLLFTWTITATFQNGGTAQDATSWRDPFRRVSMTGSSSSRSLWKTDRTEQQQQQPPRWTPQYDTANNKNAMISIPEELRIPDDEPVVQVINTRYETTTRLVFCWPSYLVSTV